MVDVNVQNLVKTYHVPEREGGMIAAIRSVVNRRTRSLHAVDKVSFQLQRGEFVGFVGPNGAGKTTTLKMLSGLLFPTDGYAEVLGHIPSKREREYLSRITLVMGQRNQLIWDIPIIDSFERNRVVYRIPKLEYRRTLGELTEQLELTDLLRRPARNLSLGERMKCEIGVALLHRPQVLFLDEPTIGLDVTMQRRIRSFLADYNSLHKTTVLLTSHYMVDVEELCKRIIIINNGRIIFDGSIEQLVSRFSPYKTVVIEIDRDVKEMSIYGDVVESTGTSYTLRVPKTETPQVTARLLADLPIQDLTVEDPPIEDIIAQVFSGSFERNSSSQDT